MTVNVINPDSTMVQQSEGHWQKYLSLVLWKLLGRNAVVITLADIQALNRAFGEEGPVVKTHGHVDSIEFQLIDHATAQRLAEWDATRKGAA